MVEKVRETLSPLLVRIMKPIDIIVKLSKTKSKKKQAEIITEAWNSDCEEFFIGLDMALNPNLNFGVNRVPEIQDEDDGEPGELTFDSFCHLAMTLANGSQDQASAKSLIEEAALSSNISEWNLWYRRIHLKSLPKFLPMEVIKDTLMSLTSE